MELSIKCELALLMAEMRRIFGSDGWWWEREKNFWQRWMVVGEEFLEAMDGGGMNCMGQGTDRVGDEFVSRAAFKLKPGFFG